MLNGETISAITTRNECGMKLLLPNLKTMPTFAITVWLMRETSVQIVKVRTKILIRTDNGSSKTFVGHFFYF